MKRKLFAFSVAAVMVASLVVGCAPQTEENPQEETTTEESAEADLSDLSLGVCIYKFDDTFMTEVRNSMEQQAQILDADIKIVDSQNKQSTQDEQVDTFVTQGVSALAVNLVDRTASPPLVEKAVAAGLPIVFVNREPDVDTMQSYDKVWYVGAKAEESGTMCGEILADYWNSNKKKVDKNGDDVLQYLMITGDPGHQDAALRTEYSIKALQDAGIAVEEILEETARWEKAKATDLMKAMLASQGFDHIEAVICNNDDMALGAIEALQQEGYNAGDPEKFIPIVGVDATDQALEAMANGSLLGTVLNDAENQGIAATNIAVQAALGKDITEDTIGYPVTDGQYVWIPYVKVTTDNYMEIQSGQQKS